MHRTTMSEFPLDEKNIVDGGIPVYKTLPEGVTEFPQSVPRQATGSGNRRFTYCPEGCKGWVPYGPITQNKVQHAMPFASKEVTSSYRCRRCGRPLDTGPVGGTEKKNKSGIGTEGTLR